MAFDVSGNLYVASFSDSKIFKIDPRQPNAPAGRQVGFSMAEVRIGASTNELCDRLTQGFPGIESPAGQSL